MAQVFRNGRLLGRISLGYSDASLIRGLVIGLSRKEASTSNGPLGNSRAPLIGEIAFKWKTCFLLNGQCGFCYTNYILIEIFSNGNCRDLYRKLRPKGNRGTMKKIGEEKKGRPIADLRA